MAFGHFLFSLILDSSPCIDHAWFCSSLFLFAFHILFRVYHNLRTLFLNQLLLPFLCYQPFVTVIHHCLCLILWARYPCIRSSLFFSNSKMEKKKKMGARNCQKHSVRTWLEWSCTILNILLISISAFIWEHGFDLISESLTLNEKSQNRGLQKCYHLRHSLL